MARTAKESKPKTKDERVQVAGNTVKVMGPGGTERYGLLQFYKMRPEMLTKAQINKLKAQGLIDKHGAPTKKSGGTIKRKSGGGIGIGKALRGGGAVRKRQENLMTITNKLTAKFGKDVAAIVEDIVEDVVKKSTKKVEKSTKKKVGRTKRRRGPKPKTTTTTAKTKTKKKKVTPSGIPTGTAKERRAALRQTKRGKKGSPERQRRGEITKLLQQSERESRADIFPAPPERGGRTATVDPVSGQIVEGGPNTRLRSLHIPDYGEKHEQAVMLLRRQFPGKSEKWYEREAIKLVERDFPKGERGEEVITGTQQQIREAMGIRPRKRGGIVRRRTGGAIGVGAALRGYGKGYKKRG